MQPLLLLHGAIGAADQLHALADRLSSRYRIYALDFSGHGGKPFGDEPFSIALFAKDVLEFIEAEQLQKVSIFGYSMGGYVAMYLAKNYPDKINRVVTLATKFHWDETIAAREVQMLNPDKIEQKLPAFAESLQQRHAPNDWKKVLKKTADMMLSLGSNNILKPEDHTVIAIPSLLLLGDRDKMVSLEETVAVYKSLPNGQMGIIPGTPHPIEQVDIAMLDFLISRFIA
jgi:pimeloyl-ACP methyl ester carboxylesterase